jgi:hypothetical protein
VGAPGEKTSVLRSDVTRAKIASNLATHAVSRLLPALLRNVREGFRRQQTASPSPWEALGKDLSGWNFFASQVCVERNVLRLITLL